MLVSASLLRVDNFEAAIYGERHTVRCSEAKSNCCIAYLVQVYLRTLWRKPNTEESRAFRGGLDGAEDME